MFLRRVPNRQVVINIAKACHFVLSKDPVTAHAFPVVSVSVFLRDFAYEDAEPRAATGAGQYVRTQFAICVRVVGATLWLMSKRELRFEDRSIFRV